MRSLRMVEDIRADHHSKRVATTQVVQPLGVGAPRDGAQVVLAVSGDASLRPGVTSETRAES